jgi:hypothetical protein
MHSTLFQTHISKAFHSVKDVELMDSQINYIHNKQ